MFEVRKLYKKIWVSPKSRVKTCDEICDLLRPGVVLAGDAVDAEPGELVAEVSESNEVLLDVELHGDDGLAWTEADQILHLLLGGQPLALQVDGEAGQEADPASRVGPQVVVLPVTGLRQFTIQLSRNSLIKQVHDA